MINWISLNNKRLKAACLAFSLGTMFIDISQAAVNPIVLELNTPAEIQGNQLRWSVGDGKLLVTALSPEIIRVRLVPGDNMEYEPSFAVVNRQLPTHQAKVSSASDKSIIQTSALQVSVWHKPFRLEVRDQNGKLLHEDHRERPTMQIGSATKTFKHLLASDQVYGFGEKTGRLNKRGMGLGGYHYTMWNSDTYGYDSSIDPIYVSVPFYMVLNGGKAYGLFVDNSHRSSFDIGREHPEVLSINVSGGELDYYFIYGPHPKSVVTRYTELTGKTPLPPMWSLGFHQSRWSYYPESRFRLLADTFRSKKIPADTLWLDIDYLEGFTPFVWNREYFPKPKKMIDDLRAKGFHVVSIVDPHPKKQVGYHVYDQGIAGNHFVKNPDGTVFEGPVWPSQAEKNPANSVFPDFARSETRRWWGDLHRELLDDGVAGIWNDMNEPAVWIAPANTMPLNVQHDRDGVATSQREIHNVYGMLHTQATFEGLSRLRPNDRPFVLTRATFAGGQRYAAVWPGDNTADWTSLRQSLPMLMGLGLSGFSFVGADIGGFAGFPSGELFTRWLQAAVFSPFMRAHTEKATPDQEPWSFGAEFEGINRRTIELRYQLLPQIYQVMEEASRTGLPALRPLLLEFPDDPQTWSRDDQFMFGSDLLVAPVLQESATSREIYLPAGQWFAFDQGRVEQGGKSIRETVTLNSLPIFVREGAFIFRQPVVQHTGEMSGQPLLVDVYPAKESTRTFYQDDGQSLAYQQGKYSRRQVSQQRNDQSVRIRIGASEGTFTPAPRLLKLRLINIANAKQVSVNGRKLSKLNEASENEQGWRVVDNHLLIILQDSDSAIDINVQP